MQATPVVGSYSCRSALSGVLGLSDLISSDRAVRVTDNSAPGCANPSQARSFDLEDLRVFASQATGDASVGFMHFTRDATQKAFLESYAGPGWSNDGEGVLHMLAAARNDLALSGVRIDRLPLAGSGVNPSVALYATVPGDVQGGRSFIQSYNALNVQVAAGPEPPALALALLGLGAFGWLSPHRHRPAHA
jgi:MYXO-CTERM domain-containing protein